MHEGEEGEWKDKEANKNIVLKRGRRRRRRRRVERQTRQTRENGRNKIKQAILPLTGNICA